MLVIDTNVISELIRPKPNRKVLDWASAALADTLFTTAICEAELLAGVAIMPAGKNRRVLQQAIETVLERSFNGRILPFESRAARRYAEVIAWRKQLGRPIKDADAQIAAICLSQSATIVTRDISGFEHLELGIINPWED